MSNLFPVNILPSKKVQSRSEIPSNEIENIVTYNEEKETLPNKSEIQETKKKYGRKLKHGNQSKNFSEKIESVITFTNPNLKPIDSSIDKVYKEIDDEIDKAHFSKKITLCLHIFARGIYYLTLLFLLSITLLGFFLHYSDTGANLLSNKICIFDNLYCFERNNTSETNVTTENENEKKLNLTNGNSEFLYDSNVTKFVWPNSTNNKFIWPNSTRDKFVWPNSTEQFNDLEIIKKTVGISSFDNDADISNLTSEHNAEIGKDYLNDEPINGNQTTKNNSMETKAITLEKKAKEVTANTLREDPKKDYKKTTNNENFEQEEQITTNSSMENNKSNKTKTTIRDQSKNVKEPIEFINNDEKAKKNTEQQTTTSEPLINILLNTSIVKPINNTLQNIKNYNKYLITENAKL